MNSRMCGEVMLEQEGLATLVTAVRTLLDRGGRRRRHHRVRVHQLRLRIYRLTTRYYVMTWKLR